MAKKTGGGKREEIIAAATELFFEHGYESTSIRMIQKEVDSEVGLFYYYFASKEELFDVVVERVLASYREELMQSVRLNEDDPSDFFTRFFVFLHRMATEFRERYSRPALLSLRYALIERGLDFMAEFLEVRLRELVALGMPQPQISIGVLASMLTHGLGNVVLHMDAENYLEKLRDIHAATRLLCGMPLGEAEFEDEHKSVVETVEEEI